MCLIIEGYIPNVDLETLKHLGDDWGREISFIPIFHPEYKDDISRQGYGDDSVKVKVRIEIEGEEKGDGGDREETG